MAEEVLQMFDHFEGAPQSYLDGTFGRGGHVALVMEKYTNIAVTGVDQDRAAVEFAKDRFKSELASGQLTIHHAPYVDFIQAQDHKYDLMLFDLGVSSPQLDEAERGFSFYHDGPLDMRMNQEQELTAAEIINTWAEEDLVKIFKDFGEVRRPYRVIRALMHDRATEPFTSTKQLAGLIERVDGWKKKGKHPATKYFLGLRLVVNQELEQLKNSLEKMIHALVPGGVLVVLTFHSLEDRIVKVAFKEASMELGVRLNKKVICATDEEQKHNTRSRSAKLRAFQRHKE